jgi:hypothetical protein
MMIVDWDDHQVNKDNRWTCCINKQGSPLWRETSTMDNRLWSKTMCVHISKLICKKINFEYKTTIQVDLSENKSFEDSVFATHNSNAFGLFSK